MESTRDFSGYMHRRAATYGTDDENSSLGGLRETIEEDAPYDFTESDEELRGSYSEQQFEEMRSSNEGFAGEAGGHFYGPNSRQTPQETIPAHHSHGHRSLGGSTHSTHGMFIDNLTPQNYNLLANCSRAGQDHPGVNVPVLTQEGQFRIVTNEEARLLLELQNAADRGESEQQDGGRGLKLLFNTVEQANDWSNQGSETLVDPTIPRSVREQKAVVLALLEAMMSVDSAEDNEGMLKPFREGRYPRERMEVACWNVLDQCIQRHERGPLLASYDAKMKQSAKIENFRERMGHIIEALACHKTICKHLLDAPYLLSFVDDPLGAKNRVVANKALNKRKGEVMSAGKEALGHTSTPGTRGRPRKISIASGSGSVGTSSSARPAAKAKQAPRVTPRSRQNPSTPAGYEAAGMGNLTVASPTPADHSTMRGQRPHGSPGHENLEEVGEAPYNPYDPDLAVAGPQGQEEGQANPKRARGHMAPPPPTPAKRPSRSAAKATSSRTKKRPGETTDDKDYAPSSKKKGPR
ncbi:hypothetical protein FQN54_006670 [Arachnomyces sp. PD_36]|nr:hypothetical protein FQN54_006670 [Arachnomyces sp. PD_36]